MPTQTITVSQLADKLRAIKGARALSITALTDTRARKTGNPYAEVLKLCRVNGMVGVDYEGAVERQQAKDNQPVGFAVRPHPWGDKVCSAMRQHRVNGKLYLTIKPERVLDKPVFFARGKESGALVSVKKENVQAFLPVKRDAAPAQGTLNEVLTRDYALSSITAITLDGQTYRVRA